MHVALFPESFDSVPCWLDRIVATNPPDLLALHRLCVKIIDVWALTGDKTVIKHYSNNLNSKCNRKNEASWKHSQENQGTPTSGDMWVIVSVYYVLWSLQVLELRNKLPLQFNQQNTQVCGIRYNNLSETSSFCTYVNQPTSP